MSEKRNLDFYIDVNQRADAYTREGSRKSVSSGRKRATGPKRPPKRRGPNPLLFRSLSMVLSAAAVLLAFGLVLRGSFSEGLPTASSSTLTASLSMSSGKSSSQVSLPAASSNISGQNSKENSASSQGKELGSSSEGKESQSTTSKPEQGGNTESSSSKSNGGSSSVSKEPEASSTEKPDTSSSGDKGNKGERGDPYPQLYVEKPSYTPHQKGDKVVYLTFDDGPSDYTLPLLDVLDRYGVKATFFDVGIRSETAEKVMKETVRRGHVLAVHSYTHDFHTIYQSTDAFLKDFKKERDYIYSVTGVEPTIFRFAGGSINSFNKKTAKGIIKEMERRGYTYYDWNVDSQDATGNNIPTQRIYANVIQGVKGKEKAIVLMHNTNAKRTTLEILPQIIEELQRMGYRFDVLDNTVEPVQFRIPG